MFSPAAFRISLESEMTGSCIRLCKVLALASFRSSFMNNPEELFESISSGEYT